MGLPNICKTEFCCCPLLESPGEDHTRVINMVDERAERSSIISNLSLYRNHADIWASNSKPNRASLLALFSVRGEFCGVRMSVPAVLISRSWLKQRPMEIPHEKMPSFRKVQLRAGKLTCTLIYPFLKMSSSATSISQYAVLETPAGLGLLWPEARRIWGLLFRCKLARIISLCSMLSRQPTGISCQLDIRTQVVFTFRYVLGMPWNWQHKRKPLLPPRNQERKCRCQAFGGPIPRILEIFDMR